MCMKQALPIFLSFLMMTFSLAGCLSNGDSESPSNEEETDEQANTYHDYSDVAMEVSHGSDQFQFKIKLNHSAAPMHAGNFETHAIDGKYDAATFHRIISGFMIQGGDFEVGDGTGGYAANWYGICNGVETTIEDCPDQADWNVPDETNNGLFHLPCTISMAKTNAANTGGSQFFIIPEDSQPSHLDGYHTVFGEITEGCEDVTEISKVPTQMYDKPSTDVVIESTSVSPRYQEGFSVSIPDRCDIMPQTTESVDFEGGVLDGRMGELPLDFSNCDFSNVDFSSMQFFSVDFSNSTFTNADLSDSNFIGGDFHNSNFEGANFNGAYIYNFQFSMAKLTSANFDFAHITDSSFDGVSFVGASFTNTTFNSIFGSSSDFTGVDLSSTSRWESVGFHNLTACPAALPDEWVCQDKILLGPNANLRNFDLSNLDLSGVNLTGATLSGTNLTSTLLENSNLNGTLGSWILSCPQSLPTDWKCVGNNLIGPSVVLRYADLSNQNLSSLNLKGVEFTLSNLTGTDFSNSDLSGAYFGGTLMNNSNLSNANLTTFKSVLMFDCPLELPSDWTCFSEGHEHSLDQYPEPFYPLFGDYQAAATRLLGPSATIASVGYLSQTPNLDFSNLNLSGAIFEINNFTGANFSLTNLDDTVWISTYCPNGEFSDNHKQSCEDQLETSNGGGMSVFDYQYNAVSISMWGGEHACGITTVGNILCWGESFDIEYDGGDRKAAAISTNGEHTCAVLDDGSITCWGDNTYGQLGGESVGLTGHTNLNLGPGRTATAIAAGNYHVCAILDDGSVSCWGSNDAGQLGDGTDENRTTPGTTVDLGGEAIAITSGRLHTCALLKNGSVSCWGSNGAGQLGDGTKDSRNTPTLTESFGTNRTAIHITAGVYHTCAILDNGSVSCWGDNEYGALGNPSPFIDNSHPSLTESLGDGRTATMLNAGLDYTCALLDDGSVSCWGRNFGNMYGQNNQTSYEIPTPTHIGEGMARYISAGNGVICIIADNVTDALDCW